MESSVQSKYYISALYTIPRTCWVRSYSIVFPNPCLDCENSDDSIVEKVENDDEIYYEEPDLSGGVEGIDYGIVYGLGDEEVEMEAKA